MYGAGAGLGGGNLFNQTPGMGGAGGGALGAGLGTGGGLFPSSSAAGTGLFNQSGLQGGGVSGIGGGSGLFNTPQSQANLFMGGGGALGGGTGLGAGLGAGLGGANTGIGMGGAGGGAGFFQSPISSAGGGIGGGGLTGNRLFNQSSGLTGGTSIGGGGVFSTPLFNRTSAANTGGGLGGLGGGGGIGGGAGMGLGIGGGAGMGMGLMGGAGVNNIGTPLAYNPTKGNDVMIKNGMSMNIYTNLHCITGMKQYENKSLEELRFEDYSCNRKGPTGGMLGGAQGMMGGGLGGTSVANTGLFTGGLGGGVGGGTGLFNTAATSGVSGGGGLFPNTSKAGGLFPNTSKAPGLVGLGAGAGNMFNTSTGQTGLTGLGAGTSTGLFTGQTGLGTTGLGAGQSQLLGGGLKPGGLGGLGTTGLGTGLGTTGLGTGLGTTGLGTGLGTTGLGGGLGGGIGMGTQGGGLGNTMFNRPLGGGLGTTGLGAGQTGQLGAGLGMGLGGGTGLGIGNTGGGIGQLKPTGLGGTGLGGNTGLGLGTGALGLAGTGANQAAAWNQNPIHSLTAQQQQAQLQQQIQLLTSSPFGDSPLFRTALSESEKMKRNKSTTPVSSKLPPTSSSVSPHYKLNIKPSAKFKPISLNSSGQRKEKNAVFEGLNDSISSNDSFVPRQSIKKLNFNPKPKATPTSLSSTPTLAPQVTTTRVATPISATPTTKPAFTVTSTGGGVSNMDMSYTLSTTPLLKPTPRRPSSAADNTITELVGGVTTEQAVTSTTPPFSAPDSPIPPPPPQVIVTLTKSDYYTRPPVRELKVDENGRCIVNNFEVGRTGFGKVVFFGATDVMGMNIDELVTISHKEITVYPDDSIKPPQGQGLNKRALVSLSGHWPICKTTRTPIKDPQRLADMNYVETLKRSTAKIDARFQDYIPETGTCVFEVDHFSKYKLVTDEDEGDEGGDGEGGEKKGGEKGKQTVTTSTATSKVATLTTATTKSIPMTTVSVTTTARPLVTTSSSRTSLLAEPVAKRPLLEEDYNMEEEEEANVSTTTLTPSHHLVNTLGLNTSKIQVMKASFFTDSAPSHTPFIGSTTHSPALTLGSSAHIKGPIKSVTRSMGVAKSNLITPTRSIREKSLDISHALAIENLSAFTTLPGSPGLLLGQPLPRQPPSDTIYRPVTIQPNSIVAPRKLNKLVAMETSIVNECTGLRLDMGMAMCRSFRVGWGPNWTLVHSGTPLSPSPVSSSLFQQTDHVTSGHLMGTVTIEKVDASPWMKDEVLSNTVEELYEPLLKTQLAHSHIAYNDDEEMEEEEEGEERDIEDVPLITPIKSQELLTAINATCSQATIDNEPQLQKQFLDVFSLVSALWGSLTKEGEEGEEEKRDNETSYWSINERKRRLSRWFMKVLKDDNNDDKDLFNLLCQYRLAEAASLSRSVGNHRISLLISQLPNPNITSRQLIAQQLQEWNRLEADQFINPTLLKVYILLSGLLVWDGKYKYINTCHELNWRQAAGLHLWYSLQPTATIKDLMESYEESFKNDDVAPPAPLYLSVTETEQQVQLYDTCHHLLQLFIWRDHSLEDTLSPSGSTPYQLDHRLSWHLWSILSSLNYDHTSSSFLVSLHTSFAAQLESVGLWEWAVFVLQHVTTPTDRYRLVREVLCRHCSFEEEANEKEKFVIERLCVPKELVFLAKAQCAGYYSYYELQASHLLTATQWNDAHLLVMSHLAPTAIVKDDIASLYNILELLSQPHHCAQIQNWDIHGSVYLDYLRVTEQVTALADATADVTKGQLDQVYTSLQCVSVRVGSLPCDTPLECLCQVEIAKVVATLLRTVTILRNQISTKDDDIQEETEELLPSLSSLPLSQEQSLFELRQLTAVTLPPL